jgi:hypothetical protein
VLILSFGKFSAEFLSDVLNLSEDSLDLLILVLDGFLDSLEGFILLLDFLQDYFHLCRVGLNFLLKIFLNVFDFL